MKTTFTDAEIGMVGANAANFPDAQTPAGQTVQWKACRDCVDGLHAMLRRVGGHIDAIDANTDLSPQGRGRQVTEIAKSALAELGSYKPLAAAEQAVGARIDALKTKITPTPKAPQTPAEAMLAAEIRAHIAKQSDPTQAAWALVKDPLAVGAITQAAFLASLTEETASALHDAHVSALHPDSADQIKQLETAVRVCRQAVASAQKMIATRATMHQVDGVWQSMKAPLA